MHAEADQAGGADTHELFGEDHIEQAVGTRAAIFFRHRRQQHAQLAGLAPHFTGYALVLLPLGVERRDFFLHEAAAGAAELVVFGVEQCTGDQVLHWVVLSGPAQSVRPTRSFMMSLAPPAMRSTR
ncbi:hypothetical protein D9M71_525670 [compost metagenome]